LLAAPQEIPIFINEALLVLNDEPRLLEVVKLHAEGYTLSEIGSKLTVSGGRAKQLLQRGIHKLNNRYFSDERREIEQHHKRRARKEHLVWQEQQRFRRAPHATFFAPNALVSLALAYLTMSEGRYDDDLRHILRGPDVAQVLRYKVDRYGHLYFRSSAHQDDRWYFLDYGRLAVYGQLLYGVVPPDAAHQLTQKE